MRTLREWIDDLRCTCPKECDCANPPPDNWDEREGVYHVSNACPIHNIIPDPDPDCPVHAGGLSWLECKKERRRIQKIINDKGLS